jgi:hypothetical protein
MSVTDIADVAEAVEALSLDECRPTCWCRLGTHDKPDRVMRWTTNEPTLRFRSEEAAR